MTVVTGYCRLSRDEDKENYASIEEQKRIIQLIMQVLVIGLSQTST